MTDLGADLVQRLARWRGDGRPVTTLYLSVDGKQHIRPEDFRQQFDVLFQDAQAKDPPPEALADLQRVKTFVDEELMRGSHRGVAVFCAGDALWEVVELPVSVTNYLVVNATPHIRQLENILDEHAVTGVLLADKQYARMYVIELGRIVERADIHDPLPRHDDDKGDWEKDHVKTHATVAVQHHVRNSANAMFDLYQRHNFESLALAVSDDMRPDMERALHDYLRQRVVGNMRLSMNASDDEIVASAHALTQRAERAREGQYVERLRAGVKANEAAGRSNGDSVGAVAGLEPTLRAVYEKRVDTLLVSAGFTAEGWRCTACGYIAAVGRGCRMCGENMMLVEDVVEEAVEDAIGQRCHVEFCTGNPDLDVMGQIGALLRF